MPVLRCRWVQGAKGVMKDLYGFTTVVLEKVGNKEEPFVLADQVSQVFYVPDTRNKKRHVVLPGKRRVVGVENVVNEEEYNQFDEVPHLVLATSLCSWIAKKPLTYGAATRIKESPRQKAEKKAKTASQKWEINCNISCNKLGLMFVI